MASDSSYQTKSLGLWFQLSDHGSLKKIASNTSLHVNYWQFIDNHDEKKYKLIRKATDSIKTFFNKSNKMYDVLDLGLMIPKNNAIKKISFYLPLTTDIKSIQDLSVFFDTQKIAAAVFNENLGVTKSPDGCVSLTKGKDDNQTTYCFVQSLTKDDKGHISHKALEIENQGSGVIISITNESLKRAFDSKKGGNDDEIPRYFRLRIPILKSQPNPIIHTITPSDKLINSGYDSIKYIDFRLNESRLLLDDIESEIEDKQGTFILPVSRIDFLLAAKLQADVVGGSQQFHKSRFLEPSLWKEYFEDDKKNIHNHIDRGMVVYHWKKTLSDLPQNKNTGDKQASPDNMTFFEDFITFVKFKERLSNLKLIIKYALWSFLIGLIGSLIGSLLYSGPPNLSTMASSWSNFSLTVEPSPEADKLRKQHQDESNKGFDIGQTQLKTNN